jgi:hypothetical protein
MKRTLFTSLVAAAALTVPAAASAHDGWHHHHHHHFRALYASLSGTGTLASSHGTIASNALGTGTFTSSVTTTGAAVTRTGDRGTLSCAPATDTLTLVGSSTVTVTLTGKSCTWTKAGATTAAGSMFWGRSSDGTTKAFVVAKSDGTVKGAVFKGFDLGLMRTFAFREHDASHNTGDCDHDR